MSIASTPWSSCARSSATGSAAGAIRVLKQWRGHSGIGVWRVQRAPADAGFGAGSLVRAKHAPRGSAELIDELRRVRRPHGAVFRGRRPHGRPGLAAAPDRRHGPLLPGAGPRRGLRPASGERAAPAPGGQTDRRRRRRRARGSITRPILPHLQGLKQRLENEWLAALERTLGIRREDLPLLWDCDFLHGEPASRRRRALRAVRDQRQQRRAVSRTPPSSRWSMQPSRESRPREAGVPEPDRGLFPTRKRAPCGSRWSRRPAPPRIAVSRVRGHDDDAEQLRARRLVANPRP